MGEACLAHELGEGPAETPRNVCTGHLPPSISPLHLQTLAWGLPTAALPPGASSSPPGAARVRGPASPTTTLRSPRPQFSHFEDKRGRQRTPDIEKCFHHEGTRQETGGNSEETTQGTGENLKPLQWSIFRTGEELPPRTQDTPLRKRTPRGKKHSCKSK